MNEDQLLKILIQYAQELGFKWRIIKKGIPRIYFKERVITIKQKDLILYHVLHEVAHILLGPAQDTKLSIAEKELLAEGISMVVRDILGFEKHPGDDHYLTSWLEVLNVTRTEFYEQHQDEIAAHAKTIAKRIRSERGTTVPFTGRRRPLATSGAFIGSTSVSNYRPGMRLCHDLPHKLSQDNGTTTEGHGTPQCLFQSAHCPARMR